jgi:hypothetical protein
MRFLNDVCLHKEYTNCHSNEHINIIHRDALTHIASRFLVVCHVGPMMGRENQIGNLILNLLVSTSVVMGLGSLLQPGHTHVYLLCMGRQEHFIMDLENIFQPFIRGIETTLPIYHPFRLGMHLSVFSFILIVHILYFKIFMFRRFHDTSVKGINKRMSIESYFRPLQEFLKNNE